METKVAYDHLQQFTVTSSTTPTTTAISFSPAIYWASTGANAPRQNVDESPADDDTLTFVGTANTAYKHSLMYHKDAFTFITADLPIMDDAIKCVRRVQDGLSVRCWQASDIRNDEMLLRLDILYGWLTLRPEWACRITS